MPKKIVELGAQLVTAPSPTLVDIRGVRKVSADAREYFSSPRNLLVSSSVALLVSGAVSSMIANFFIGLSRPPVPIRLFSDRERAMAWLRG